MNDDIMAGANGLVPAHPADLPNPPPISELTAPVADAADSVSRTVGENIGLTLLGALALGLVAGAVVPLSRRRRRPKTARALATTLAATVSELTQTLASQARERAGSAVEDGRDKLDSASRTIGKSIHDNSESLGKQAKKLADDAADQLNDSGKAVARKLVKWVEKARR